MATVFIKPLTGKRGQEAFGLPAFFMPVARAILMKTVRHKRGAFDEEATHRHTETTPVGAMPYCFLNAAEKCDWFLKPTFI